MVASGVDSSCAAPAASVVSDTSRSLRAARARIASSSCSRRASAFDACTTKYATSSAVTATAIHIVNRCVGKSFSR